MKKMVLNVKILSFTALIAGSFAISSCNNVKCNEPRDDNYESTTNECDEAATVGKFTGNWTGTPGSYPFNVTAGTDYKINVSTNFGLTDNSGNLLAPTNLNGWNVSKNQATLSSANLYNGTVNNASISFISSTSATVKYTLSGFGPGIDNEYTESLTK